MAARDRNLFVWQVYVVTMSVVSAVLLILFGIFMYSSMTQTKIAEEATTKLADLQSKLSKENNKLQYLRHTTGDGKATEAELEGMKSNIAGDEEMEAIQKRYEENMTLFGPNTPKSEQTYPNLVENLMKALRQRNIELQNATQLVEEAKEEIKSVRAQETAAREKAEAKSEELAKQLANARDEYKEKEDALKGTITALTDEKTEMAQKQERAEAKLRNDIASLKSENATLVKFKSEVVAQRIENEREDFASPQGKVVAVDAKGVQLWINLGRKDGLKTGQRFSILNSDTIRVTEATPKAQIEITAVSDDHQAQARVIQDRLSVPVIMDDLVYSPTWQPGQKTQYALLGKMEVNGLDSREMVRNLIEQNGGLVVEDVGPDTKSIGRLNIDINTTYLVIGELPSTVTEGNLDSRTKELMEKYSAVRKKAKDSGVREISLTNLLGLLRKYDDDRTIGIGDATRSEDFRDRRGPVRSNVSPSSRDYGITPKGPLSGNGK